MNDSLFEQVPKLFGREEQRGAHVRPQQHHVATGFGLPQPLVPNQELGKIGRLLLEIGPEPGLTPAQFVAVQSNLVVAHQGCRTQVSKQTPTGKQGPHNIGGE
ncbi:MAG: hypothetical protein ACJ8CR_17950 [Roseiflexaceae bacterium]